MGIVVHNLFRDSKNKAVIDNISIRDAFESAFLVLKNGYPAIDVKDAEVILVECSEKDKQEGPVGVFFYKFGGRKNHMKYYKIIPFEDTDELGKVTVCYYVFVEYKHLASFQQDLENYNKNALVNQFEATRVFDYAVYAEISAIYCSDLVYNLGLFFSNGNNMTGIKFITDDVYKVANMIHRAKGFTKDILKVEGSLDCKLQIINRFNTPLNLDSGFVNVKGGTLYNVNGYLVLELNEVQLKAVENLLESVDIGIEFRGYVDGDVPSNVLWFNR